MQSLIGVKWILPSQKLKCHCERRMTIDQCADGYLMTSPQRYNDISYLHCFIRIMIWLNSIHYTVINCSTHYFFESIRFGCLSAKLFVGLHDPSVLTCLSISVPLQQIVQKLVNIDISISNACVLSLRCMMYRSWYIALFQHGLIML